MKDLLKYKDFTKMFIANTISRFGDSIDMVAYGYMIYQLTGSKLLLATIYVFNVLPSILFSSFSGTVVDFFSKKKITVIGDILRGSLVFLTAIMYSLNLLETWHLFFFTFLTSSIENFVSPCKFATIPKLIDEKHYHTVNSTLQSVTKFVELVGLAIAGSIIGFIGISGAMVINGITFLTSAILILAIRFPVEEHKELTKGNYINSYKEGMSFVFKQKAFLYIILGYTLLSFYLTPINALAPAYIEDILQMGPEGIGYFSLAFVVGNIVGGFLVGKVGNHISPSKSAFIGLFFTGIFYAALALPAFVIPFSPMSMACISMFLIGGFIPFAWASMGTFIMSNVPKDMLARVNSLINMFVMSANPLGAFASGIIVSFVGLEYLLIVFGILFCLTTYLPVRALTMHEKANAADINENVENPALEY